MTLSDSISREQAIAALEKAIDDSNHGSNWGETSGLEEAREIIYALPIAALPERPTNHHDDYCGYCQAIIEEIRGYVSFYANSDVDPDDNMAVGRQEVAKSVMEMLSDQPTAETSMAKPAPSPEPVEGVFAAMGMTEPKFPTVRKEAGE